MISAVLIAEPQLPFCFAARGPPSSIRTRRCASASSATLVEPALVELAEADALRERGVDLLLPLGHARRGRRQRSLAPTPTARQPSSAPSRRGRPASTPARSWSTCAHHERADRDADAEPEQSLHRPAHRSRRAHRARHARRPRWRALRSALSRARSSASSSAARRLADGPAHAEAERGRLGQRVRRGRGDHGGQVGHVRGDLRTRAW